MLITYNLTGETVEVPELFIEEQVDIEMLANQIRQERNRLLSETDWTQLTDSPLTEELKNNWKGYRQNLRDITAQENFPLNVIFPTKPI